MVAEGDRLRHLEMGKAGHDGGGVALRLDDERPLKRLQVPLEPVDGVAHPQAKIGRHLIVARARGVQPPRRRADQLGKPRLDVEMDVLVLGAKGKVPGLDFGADLG